MQLGELKVFSGRSNLPLAHGICEYLDIPLGKMKVTQFPDQETFVRFDENIRGCDVFLVQSTNPPANDYLMELLIMMDAARRASARRVTAVIPFYGYSRQDRKDQPRVPITAKLVANLLVTAGADRVIALDLHAQQIQGFFDIPVDHLYASPVFFDYLAKFKSKQLMVFSPDVGGVKVASAYADTIGCGLGFVAKKRTSSETVETLNLVGEVRGRDVLLIDDMTESAGTLTAAAKLLREKGANSVRAAVTHAILNEKSYERLSTGILDELITTNSTPVDPKDLPMRVLNVAPLLAQGIKRIHNHESVSSLFKIKGY